MLPAMVQKTNRFLILDSLRGLMLVILAFDHYGGFVRNITYEPLGFVTAAEGFIFLAGLMLGIIYVKKMAVNPQLVVQKLLSRTFKIYLTYVSVLLVFLAVLQLSPGYAVSWQALLPAGFTNNLETTMGALLVVYQTRYVGILALYVVLFLFAPLYLWLFARGYTRLLLAASVLLYLAQPFWGDSLFRQAFPYASYNFFTWNILFVLGIYFGHSYKNGTLNLSFRPKYLVPIIVLSLSIFVLREMMRFDLLGSYAHDVKVAFALPYLSPLRLLDFFFLSYLLVGLARLKPQWLRNPWFAFLGQHSLYVFAFHAVVLYLVWPVIGDLNRDLESCIFVASLSIPAWLHLRWQQWRVGRLEPAALPR